MVCAARRLTGLCGKVCAGLMTLDVENYLHHLDGMDLSEAEKAEFIRTLWLIAQCFVDDADSGTADNVRPHFSSLESGFEAANVIRLSTVKQTSATAANDNAALRAEKERETRERRA
jgi:hypothetical protein